MQGRKPKPTKLKLIQGTAQKCRMNPAEPAPEIRIPDPPAILNRYARQEWERVAPELEQIGILSNIDMAALAAYCQAFGRWQEAEESLKASSMLIKTSNGNVIQNPFVGIANKALFIMHKYMTEFGMTPSSRTRVTAQTQDNDNAFGALRHG